MKMPPMKAMVIAVALSGASLAAAQQPPAAATTHIFFDWGKIEINQDGMAVLDSLASRLSRPDSGPVAIVGHSDRSGPAGANRRSALHRAEAVRDYLVQHGVAASLLRVSSSGEDALLIPTADGVREPQNRRVDIDFAKAN